MDEENKQIRVALDSLGCKVNQAEIELLARQFAEAGYRIVPPDDGADIYILNTCTVTRIADRKTRQQLRMAHIQNPHALLVATGCYAQRAPEELSRIEGIGLVTGNKDKPHLLRLLEEAGYKQCFSQLNLDNHHSIYRTRTLVKIQDGCNSFCSYCIVPLVRSREESLPVEHIVTEVKKRAAWGYKEVVLTGVKIGAYKYDGTDLKQLMENILAATEIERIRLSSLQPHEISPELLSLWKYGRLCRHFHMSLQSGCDRMLRGMRRNYSTGEYQRSVSLVRSLVPGAAITTDIIAGFPGETETDFEESYEFCRQIEFARTHVFPYSPREGTQAALMPEQVDNKMKKQRSQRMLSLAKESARNFNRQFLGETIPVLWEKETDGVWSGLTDNYIRVHTRSSEDLTNRILMAKLLEIRNGGVWGEALF